jgi:hypothetical protein
VDSWRVLAGSGPGQLSVVSNTAKSGFETAIALSQDYPAYQVQALDASGQVIGTSKVFGSKS